MDSLAKYIYLLHIQQHHKCRIDAELFFDTKRSVILAAGSERPCTVGCQRVVW